jgi:hypothetical protein
MRLPGSESEIFLTLDEIRDKHLLTATLVGIPIRLYQELFSFVLSELFCLDPVLNPTFF